MFERRGTRRMALLMLGSRRAGSRRQGLREYEPKFQVKVEAECQIHGKMQGNLRPGLKGAIMQGSRTDSIRLGFAGVSWGGKKTNLAELGTQNLFTISTKTC